MAGSEAFVGRERQLADLLGHWRAAAEGRGRFVLVEGEAGIGKTRLVEELAAGVGNRARVAWGACAGPDAPPLWPWHAVLRDLGAGSATTVADGPAHAGAGDLADPAGDRAREHARLVDRIRHAATGGPVLLVVDDLHWADADSVGLLRMLAGEVRRLPVLLVATLRPDEIRATSSLRDTLADLAPSTEIVHLHGLAAPACGRLVGELIARSPTDDLTAAVLDTTGGNPFFVREVLRLLVTEGSLDSALGGAPLQVPPSVRDVLLRRVSQLPSAARALLGAAAVAGRETPVPVLAAVVQLDADDVVAAVDEAEAARLVTVADGRLRFAHDLVRDALVADLDAADRRRHHLAVGRALRDLAPDASAAEIAGHLIDALPAGDAGDAAAAALEAGRQSLAAHAPVDAARHLERGVAALGVEASPHRVALLLELGEARATAGDRPAARQAYLAAAEAARTAGEVDQLALAALGFAGLMGTTRPDPERVALLEEALAALDGRRDALVSRVMARLAHALLFFGDQARRLRLADGALALAREVGDDQALASALYVWNIVHVTSANFELRRDRAEELLALGRASGVEEVEAWALHFHAHHAAEGGDFAVFDADVTAGEAIARRTRQATWQWTALVHRAMRATMQGAFDEGEALGNEAFEIGSRSEHTVAAATFGSHLVVLRTWQGRLDELLPLILAGAGRHPEIPATWAAVPFAYAELGQLDEAADQLRRVAADRALEDVPGAQSWTVALAMLARAAAVTGDAEVAERVGELLRPLADRHVVGPFADCYYGPAALYAGLCAGTTGRLDRAVAELEQAVRQARAVGARPVAAWATAELAAAIERAAGDAGRAATLRAEAAAELAALGMPRHLAAVGEAPGEAATEAAMEAAASAEPNAFLRTAGGWTVTYAGRTIELRPTKGLADIHRLLAAPGVELHVLELAQEVDGARVVAGVRQPVLDEQAKASYRQQVLGLQAEVDDARTCNDPVRAERAEAELDRVVAELAAGLGFGGRDRSMTDEAERARQAVRARIRYTLDRLEAVHPELRRHLERSLDTGTFCSYRPERPTTWVVS